MIGIINMDCDNSERQQEALNLNYRGRDYRYIDGIGRQDPATPFLTKFGYIGLGPTPIMLEDSVCIFARAEALLALC
jgi:hypothetical protein